MKRGLVLLLTVAVLLALVGGVYVRRFRASNTGMNLRSAVQPSMADLPSGGAADQTSPPASTPRGEVTIDPRRQQLIGVRTVPVTREGIVQAVRSVGVVRYDETKLADVNLKIEGWIRELYVDYTGQLIQKGQPLFTLYSPDLLNTQNEYVLALTTRDQIQRSTIPDARQRADDLVAAARQRLAARGESR